MTKENEKKETLTVVQTSSHARCVQAQILSLKGLGLGKIGKKVTVLDNPCTRGLLRKVAHLVKVEDS